MPEITQDDILKFDATDNELEEQILFWIVAAGKSSKSAAKAIKKLLAPYRHTWPFAAIADMQHRLPNALRDAGIGCYFHKSRSMLELVHSGINLRTCTPQDLEQIYGIGPKTSRCFILYSRRNARYAGLDRHMLKFLSDAGFNVPRLTPGNPKRYEKIEQIVLQLADTAGMAPAEFDAVVWNHYAKH